MPGWFHKGLSPHHTALAMIGAKPGDRVVVLGADDPALAGEVALVTGLNGSTTICDATADARARVEAAAARAGALLEFEVAQVTTLPMADGSLDVVVLLGGAESRAGNDQHAALQEAMRVLRPGGRIIVIHGATRGGLFRGRQDQSRRPPAEEVLGLLEHVGTKARRQLADVDGVAYYEARKS